MEIHLRTLFKSVAAIMTAILIFSLPSSVSAAVRKSSSRTRSVRNEIGALSRELNQVAREYEIASIKLYKINRELRKNEAALEVARKELENSQAVFNKRISAIYRHGHVEFIEVLLGTEDFSEFTSRLELLKRIGQQDTLVLNQIKKRKAEIDKRNAALVEGKKSQRALVRTLASKRAQMEAKLRRKKATLARSQASAGLSRSTRRLKLAVSRASYTLRGGFIFPIAGAHALTNSFGDPRRGHRHQGNDIFALRGTPVVAVVSGSVSATYTGGGGKTIYLYGSDGNTYIYMHLNGYAVTGGSVSQGQVIGYVGSTGNARGSSSHLHFEIRPGGGRAIDPYPILAASH